MVVEESETGGSRGLCSGGIVMHEALGQPSPPPRGTTCGLTLDSEGTEDK